MFHLKGYTTVMFARGLHRERSKSCQQKNDRFVTSGDPGQMLGSLRPIVSAARSLVLTTLFNKQKMTDFSLRGTQDKCKDLLGQLSLLEELLC